MTNLDFIPCTCPESEDKNHGHIYDNDKKENSTHIYNEEEGLKYLKCIFKEKGVDNPENDKTFKKVSGDIKNYFSEELSSINCPLGC